VQNYAAGVNQSRSFSPFRCNFEGRTPSRSEWRQRVGNRRFAKRQFWVETEHSLIINGIKKGLWLSRTHKHLM